MELPNGIYQARATRAALGETKEGNERVAVEFELLTEGFAGQRITWYGYFTDKAFPITIKALRACGWYGDDLSDLSGIEINEVELDIQNEAYEGKVSARVKWVNAPGSGGMAFGSPLPTDRAKALAARMRGQLLALEKSEGRRPASSSNRRGFPQGDPRPEPPPLGVDPADDIPF